jgi:predicted PurR-regulated permease PerM
MDAINLKVIRQIFILLLIFLLGGLIFKYIAPYLSGVLGAVTLYVLLRKPMIKLVQRGWPSSLAAALLLFLSFVGILLPLTGIALMLGNKIENTVANSQQVIKAIQKHLIEWEGQLGYDFTSQMDVSAISSWLGNNLRNIAGGTFNAIIAVTLMYFLLYYMLTNWQKLRESLFEYLPMSNENLEIMGNESQAIVKSNTLGIPLVAVAQGIVALLGFFIFGVENPFFWFVIVIIGSVIPFVGVGVGILPVFILALSSGNTFQAWGIFIYGLVVVGATDNIFRLYILKKLDNVHPLITLIGVIIGVPMFGFIGLIFGPLLVSLFLIVVRIYKSGYGKGEGEGL